MTVEAVQPTELRRQYLSIPNRTLEKSKQETSIKKRDRTEPAPSLQQYYLKLVHERFSVMEARIYMVTLSCEIS